MSSVTNVTLGVVFVAGMITTVLAVVGLGLLMGGMRRNRRLRQERRTLRRENEQLSQRVETAPVAAEPATTRHDDPVRDDRPPVVHDDRTQVMHDDRTQVMHDDRTRADADGPPRTDQAPVAAAPPAESGARRSLQPQREDRVHTESGPRNS